uniref:RRM domain-containing protein n=2 Tax=Kalanchoe fedtschenkoi TaxID=63787 RepID=A0A7N0ZWG5_KALFE
MYGSRAMLGTGGFTDGYEGGSKRQRMMESNPYFAESSRAGAHPYGYGVGAFPEGYDAASKRQRMVGLNPYYAEGSNAAAVTPYRAETKLQPSGFPVVRLRGLPFNCTDIDILKFFAGLNIVDILLVNKGGRFSGEALVVFSDLIQADLALQRDKQNMGRRYVEVFKCKRQDYYQAVAAEVNGDARDLHRNSSPIQLKKVEDKDQMKFTEFLKMRGLPFSVTKSQICDFFGDFKLKEDRVQIACRLDGKATGEAYVEFDSAEDAKNAMSMDKMTIGTRYVELFPSTPDEARRARSKSRQ